MKTPPKEARAPKGAIAKPKAKAANRKAPKSKASPKKTSPSKAEPSQDSPSKASPSKASPSKASPSKALPSKASPSKPKPKGKAKAKCTPKAKASPKMPPPSKATSDEGATKKRKRHSEDDKSFARRAKPKRTVPLNHWTAIRDVFRGELADFCSSVEQDGS